MIQKRKFLKFQSLFKTSFRQKNDSICEYKNTFKDILIMERRIKHFPRNILPFNYAYIQFLMTKRFFFHLLPQ